MSIVTDLLNVPALLAAEQSQGVTSGQQFERALRRMTAAHAERILRIDDWMVAGAPSPPAHLTAEGALEYWNYPGGPDAVIAGSDYAGGILWNAMRATGARARLRDVWDADPVAFLSTATADDADEIERLIDPNLDPSDVLRTTTISYWDENDYDTLLAAYPTANSRANLSRSAHPYLTNGSLPDTTALAKELIAQPAGTATMRMGALGSASQCPLFRVPVSGGDADGRKALFNREFDHAKRCGRGLETWEAAIQESDSKQRQFGEALKAALVARGQGNLPIHLILDFEVRPGFWRLKNGITGLPGYTATTAVASAGNTTNEQITTAAPHGFYDGEPVKLGAGTGALPTSSPQVVAGTALGGTTYHVHVVDSTNVVLYTTAANAITAGATGRINLTNVTGIAGVVLTGVVENFSNVFTDSDWETFRTEELIEQSQVDWNSFQSRDIQTYEPSFIFDAWYRQYFAEKIDVLVRLWRDECGLNITTSDYNGFYSAPGSRPTYTAPNYGVGPSGLGAAIGYSAPAVYGVFDTSRFKWTAGDIGAEYAATGAVEQFYYATASSVSASGDRIITTAKHPFTTGDAVTMSGSNLPGGMDAVTTYYVKAESNTSLRFYTSAAYAIAGGETGLVNITSAGSGGINIITASGTTPALRPWFAFSQDLQLLRSCAAASSNPIAPWLACNDETGSAWTNNAALWREFVLHATMFATSGRVLYYGSSGSPTAAQHKEFVDLIAEADDVMRFHATHLEPLEIIDDWDSAYRATRAWCGYQWVWRVTPNPLVGSTTLLGVNGAMVFTFGDGTTLSIPGAKPIGPSFNRDLYTGTATLGYWIGQPEDTRGSKRRRSGVRLR